MGNHKMGNHKMGNQKKRVLCLILAGALALLVPATSFAKDGAEEATQGNANGTVEGKIETGTEDDKKDDKGPEDDVSQDGLDIGGDGNIKIGTAVEDDNVQVEKGDKPYLALGANLSEEQKATVLSLMGVDPAKLSDYDVVTVTNEMEHQYLDAYLPASTIGTRALSSVLIMEGKKGSGIEVSVKNINYCTVGMYKSALATAGIEDAEVIVAGPTPISGTAALIGALKAYTEMTGEEIEEDSLDTAMNELVVTGELADITGGDTAKAEQFMAYLKQEVVKNGLDDEEAMGKVIDKGCEEFGITLTEGQKTQILTVLKKISKLDLDWDQLASQAADLYQKLDDMGLLAGNSFGDKLRAFFQAIINFFKGLFS